MAPRWSAIQVSRTRTVMERCTPRTAPAMSGRRYSSYLPAAATSSSTVWPSPVTRWPSQRILTPTESDVPSQVRTLRNGPAGWQFAFIVGSRGDVVAARDPRCSYLAMAHDGVAAYRSDSGVAYPDPDDRLAAPDYNYYMQSPSDSVVTTPTTSWQAALTARTYSPGTRPGATRMWRCCAPTTITRVITSFPWP